MQRARQTLLIAIPAGLGFIVAYPAYGLSLGDKLFRLDATAETPSTQINDVRYRNIWIKELDL